MSELYEFIDAQHAAASSAPGITLMCAWLEVLRSGFYERTSRPESATAKRQEKLRRLSGGVGGVLAAGGLPAGSCVPTTPVLGAADLIAEASYRHLDPLRSGCSARLAAHPAPWLTGTPTPPAAGGADVLTGEPGSGFAVLSRWKNDARGTRRPLSRVTTSQGPRTAHPWVNTVQLWLSCCACFRSACHLRDCLGLTDRCRWRGCGSWLCVRILRWRGRSTRRSGRRRRLPARHRG